MILPRRQCFSLSFATLLLVAGQAIAQDHQPRVTVDPVEAGKHRLTIKGTRFLLDGKPFPYTGVSFFNAIYNPAFHRTSSERRRFMQRFKQYGVNVFRIWAQWDNKRGFVDAAPDHSLYRPDGSLRVEHLATLHQLLQDADREEVVVELTLFSQESWREKIRLGASEADQAVAALTLELLPYRHVTFQIWNEFDERVAEHVATIRKHDPERLITNSPGVAGVLGDDRHNALLDYLTPHTSRQNAGKPWELAPREIATLLRKTGKPVVDDEPARNGTAQFGGPRAATSPFDHIVQIIGVRRVGGYVTYHHDMFQTGAGSPAVPPHGIPDPEFSPYHRQVFEFLALRDRYDTSGLEADSP